MPFQLQDICQSPSVMYIKMWKLRQIVDALAADKYYPLPERRALKNDTLKILEDIYEDLQLDDDISTGMANSNVEFFTLGLNPERDWLCFVRDLYVKLDALQLPRMKRRRSGSAAVSRQPRRRHVIVHSVEIPSDAEIIDVDDDSYYEDVVGIRGTIPAPAPVRIVVQDMVVRGVYQVFVLFVNFFQCCNKDLY